MNTFSDDEENVIGYCGCFVMGFICIYVFLFGFPFWLMDWLVNFNLEDYIGILVK